MQAQLQLVDVADPEAARLPLLESRRKLLALANDQDAMLVQLGGGVRDLTVRSSRRDVPGMWWLTWSSTSGIRHSGRRGRGSFPPGRSERAVHVPVALREGRRQPPRGRDGDAEGGRARGRRDEGSSGGADGGAHARHPQCQRARRNHRGRGSRAEPGCRARVGHRRHPA